LISVVWMKLSETGQTTAAPAFLPCRGGGLGIALLGKAMVEPIGIEPMTSSLQS
jgi:hypothetical protein